VADPFNIDVSTPAVNPFGSAAPSGPSQFAQAIALARQHQAEARLAQQQAAAVDTHAAKVIKQADDVQNFVAAQAIRDKVTKLDTTIGEKLALREQADGRTLNDTERAKFRLDYIKQFSSSLAGTKGFENEVVKLAQATGDAQSEFKRLEKEQPGFFRNAGGAAGAFGGSIISSVADTASGILTLAGVDRDSLALKLTTAVSKGGQAIGAAAGTKEQVKAQAAFSKAIDDGDVGGMFKALGDAPGYMMSQLAGGIVGPSGVVGMGIKTARQLETVAKFGTALAKYGQSGNVAQKLLAGAAGNVPAAVGFGLSEAGQAADDAERILLQRNPKSTEEEINNARFRAAEMGGGITAAGTLIAPGLEKATGKAFGAFGKKTGDALTRDLEAAVASRAGGVGAAGAVGAVEAGAAGAAAKLTAGGAAKKAGGVLFEGTTQGLEEGLVAGAGAAGADYAQGLPYTPTFNPAAAALGAVMGSGGKVVGNISDSVSERRQNTANTEVANTIRTQDEEVAKAAQAAQAEAEQQTQQQTQQTASDAQDAAAAVTNGAQAEGMRVANEIVSTPTALAKLRQDAASGVDPIAGIAQSEPYTKALDAYIAKSFPDPAVPPTPEQTTAVKEAFDTQLKQMAQMPVEPAEASTKKTEALARVTAGVKKLNTLVSEKGDDSQRADSAKLSDSLKDLLDSKPFLSTTEFGAEADRITAEVSGIRERFDVADAVRGKMPSPPEPPKAATSAPSAIPEPPKPPEPTQNDVTADKIKAGTADIVAKVEAHKLDSTTDKYDLTKARRDIEYAISNLPKVAGNDPSNPAVVARQAHRDQVYGLRNKIADAENRMKEAEKTKKTEDEAAARGLKIKTQTDAIEAEKKARADKAVEAEKKAADKAATKATAAAEEARAKRQEIIKGIDRAMNGSAPTDKALDAVIVARDKASLKLGEEFPDVIALDQRINEFKDKVKQATNKETTSAPAVASEPPKPIPAQPVPTTAYLLKRLKELSPNSKAEATQSTAQQTPEGTAQNDAQEKATGTQETTSTQAAGVLENTPVTDNIQVEATPELKALAETLRTTHLGEPPLELNEGDYVANLNPSRIPAFLRAPLTPAAIEAIRQNNVIAVLTDLSKNGSTPLVREVAARLLLVGLGGTKIRFAAGSEFNKPNVLGTYSPNTVSILIHNTNGLNEHVVLHEITHAATLNAIVNPQTELQRAAVAEMIRIYKVAQASPEINKGEYAFTNVAEFVSEMFSNKEFQKQLARVQDPGTPQTLFSRMIHAILSIVGVNNLLGSSFRAAELLLAPPSNLKMYRIPKFDGSFTLKGVPMGAQTNANQNEHNADAATQKSLELIGDFETGINDRLATAIRTGDHKGVTGAITTTFKEVASKTGVRNALDWIEGKALYITAMRDIGYLMKSLFTPKEGPNTGVNLLNKVIDQVALRGAAINGAMKDINVRLADLYGYGKLNHRVANELMSTATQLQFSPDRAEPKYRAPKTPEETKLQNMWDALTPTSAERKVYQVSRTMMQEQRLEQANATEQAMLKYGALATDAKKIADEIRNSGLGVYFAQDRHGSWVTSVKASKDGEQLWFGRHTTRTEAEAINKQLREKYPNEVISNVSLYQQHERPKLGVAKEEFIQRVVDGLKTKGLAADELVTIEQRMREVYESTLVTDANKNALTRKFIAGASEDMLQANLRVLRSGATAIANITFQRDILGALSDAKGFVNINQNDPKYDTPRAQQALDIFTKAISYSAQDNPLNTAANTINKIGFIHTMFANVSSSVVNAIGGSIMTTAEIGARYGTSGSAKLPTAMLDASRALYQLRQNNKNGNPGFDGLPADVRKVFEHAEKYNVIGAAETHEVMDITNESSYIGRKVMKAGGYMMSVSENITNMGAMIAAYRAAMEAPSTAVEAKRRGTTTSELALDIATEIRYRSNPDNSASNKSYLQRTPGGRVMLQLKSYGFAVASSMYRDVRSIADSQSSKEEKAYAMKHLTGVIAMHAVAAGASGLPFMITAPFALMAWLAASAMGEGDDEQANLPVAVRIKNSIYESYGEDVGNYMYHGILGAGLSKRVTLNNLILQDPFGKPTNEPVDYLKQLAGPTFGAMESYAKVGGAFMDKVGVVGTAEAAKQAVSGGGLPAGLANVIKGYSLYSTPPSQKDGTPLLADDNQITTVEALFQALGFRPSKVALASEKVQAEKSLVSGAVADRRVIMEIYRYAFHQASQGGDTEAMIDGANTATQAYNAKYPEKNISATDILGVQKKLDARSSGLLVHLPNADAKIVGRLLPWIK